MRRCEYNTLVQDNLCTAVVGRTCISLTQNVTNVQCCEAVFVLVGGQVRTELILMICHTLLSGGGDWDSSGALGEERRVLEHVEEWEYGQVAKLSN